MTAQCIGAVTDAPIELRTDLQERCYGDIRGLSYDDVGAHILAPNYEPPGGESWDVFHARVTRAWTRIIASGSDGNLAVVTHGLVCHSLALHHLTLPADVVAPLSWGNASLTVIEDEPPWSVSVLNCSAHLKDLDLT